VGWRHNSMKFIQQIVTKLQSYGIQYIVIWSGCQLHGTKCLSLCSHEVTWEIKQLQVEERVCPSPP